MIIKKPYAFLIRNFRLIHGLLFVMIVYLGIKTVNIYNFFSTYTSGNAYQLQTVVASEYVDFIMFGACLLVIGIALMIYYLLSLKQKSNNMYLWIFIFYLFLFIFFIYSHSLLKSIETLSIKKDSLGIINELCLIALLPQFVFGFIMLGRALGFNLKQFEFKKDLEELEIDSSDSEEVELTLGGDTYKIKRTFRRLLRLSKYFFVENRVLVIGCTSALILIVLLSIYTKYNVYSVSYDENQAIMASTLGYKVNESYITDMDISNGVIKDGKYYVLVNVNITNNIRREFSMTRETFSLELPNRTIIPTFNLKNEFRDLGEIFTPSEIKLGTSKDYIVVFEIDKSELAKDYILKVKNFDDNTMGKIETKYKNIIIKPKDIASSLDKGFFEYGSTIKLNDTILKNYEIKINKFEISDKYREKYNKKVGDETIDSYYSIIPTQNRGKTSILKIDASFINKDENVYMSKYIIYPVDLFSYYGLISYRYLGEYKTVKLSKINVLINKNNFSYLEIPSEVEKANRVKFILLIRGVKYTFNLK